MPHAEPSSLFSLIAFLADPTPEGGIAELARRARYNVRTLLSNPAGEISGALGDLGTLLPIMIAMTLQGAVDLPATLVSSGVWSVVAGGVFGVPVGVQPMKVWELVYGLRIRTFFHLAMEGSYGHCLSFGLYICPFIVLYQPYM